MRTFGLTMPYGVPSREYASMCRFQNSIEDAFGVKMVGLKALDHGRKGLVLEMAGKNCSYELQWENGMIVLGRFYQGMRQMLYKGSPAVEYEWTKLFHVVRDCEMRMKAESPRLTMDVAEIKRNYAPKLDIQPRLRM